MKHHLSEVPAPAKRSGAERSGAERSAIQNKQGVSFLRIFGTEGKSDQSLGKDRTDEFLLPLELETI